MNKYNYLNILIGVIIAFQSVVLPYTFMTPILVILGFVNLFLGFNGLELIEKFYNRNSKK